MTRTVEDILREFLAMLPKCHACEKPATRMMMSEHIAIPQSYRLEHGKSFVARPYAGASMGAQFYQPTDGTWQWECCDEHSMPEWMKPMRSFDHKQATAIRDLYAILSPKGDA